MKVYAGSPAAARAYLEADRGRADDYYLAEGTGVARRFTAAAERVQELAPLSGDAYEVWVAGVHPDIAEAEDAAQDRAAAQIVGWLGQHVTTRVGPRGGQVQVPVEALE